ncbi:MAG TPA: serine/threonine-protein kinase [Solirubrobacteraceae bacterium]|nr:serine/threonine-protein kinase [Solirubrobacteraceae bacterium]
MGDQSHADARVQSELGLPGRYEPLRHIATGGMASVWCARDQALGRNVAIKLLAERFAHDDAAAERFMREARAAARLSGHPNVVMIYDVGETHPAGIQPARGFIVMEYLAGGTVADALRVDSVRRVHTVKWLHEASSALDYAHSRGVLHRDIKPANLLLARDRTLHVADFGIARLGAEDTITATGQVLGTASYLAPERALGRDATDASDRYSLAVVAYELLVGERPFTAPHFTAQARQHVEDEPPAASLRNRGLPPAVDAVLARGMAKRPEDRWPSAHEFAQALESALREPATRPLRAAAAPAPRAQSAPRRPAPSPSPPAPGRRRRRRGPRVSALAALAAAAVVAVALAGTLGGGGSRATRSSVHDQQAAVAKTTTARHSTAPAKPVKTRKPHPTQTQTVTATSAAATTPPPTAETLEAQGHQLMTAGNYTAAIPVLRQAIADASPNSLTYAYALYDLGRSLRLAGDPREAVQVLWQRLQIPNQTGVVRQELQLALLALGQKANGGAAPAPGPAGTPGQQPGGPAGGPGPGPAQGGPGAGDDQGD